MGHRFFRICGVWFAFFLMVTSDAFSMTALTNQAMGAITGQATAQPSNEARETAYTVRTETSPYTDTLQVVLPKPHLLPSTLDNGNYSTVFMDFIGVDANEALGVKSENFNGSIDVTDIIYTDNDSLTSIILSGLFTGFFEVPTVFSDGFKTHDIQISESGIPTDVITDYNEGNSEFVLSYQGSVYRPEHVGGETTTFSVRPNRQVQTVGKAGGKPLNILVPQGHGADTKWNVIATIPSGKTFIQVDVNRLITHHTLKYTVKIANNRGGLNAGDINSLPTDRSGTLGTFYMGGNGKTIVEPASLIITTFNDEV